MTTTVPAVPSCRSKADIERLSGQRCTVIGIYRQVDVRMRKQGPPQYRGHAAVQLADGLLVAIEPSWSRAGMRDKSERDKYDGKSVAVTGVIHRVSPAPPEPAAHATGSAISPVETIALSQ